MNLQVTVPLVLAEDVLLFPVEELSAAERTRVGASDGDFALTRPRSRKASSVVDADSAALVSRFRSPSTIADAVIGFSRAAQREPHAVLQAALPMLVRLIHSRLLLPATDRDSRKITASLEVGDTIGGFEVTRLVALMEDVEAYQVRSTDGRLGFVKAARSASSPGVRAVLEREAALLSSVGLPQVPRVLACAMHGDMRFLALEWRDGLDPVRASEEAREGGEAVRAPLLDSCIALASAYAALHESGLAHGDVHTGNILVDRAGAVSLIDFGQARPLADGESSAPKRGAAFPYYDPELAASWLPGASGRAAATAASDQYGVGIVLYEMVTGGAYLEFSVRRDVAMRQVLEELPRPFTACGVKGWGALEAVFHRMLAKRAGDRFASMRAVVDALAEIRSSMTVVPADQPADQHANQHVVKSPSRFARGLLRRLSPEGTVYQTGFPTGVQCSVNFGAAGVACAWYRLALLRDDAAALSTAYAWVRRAETWSGQPEAFYDREKTLSPKSVGRISLYHTPTGVFAVRALVANALGRPSDAAMATEAFVKAGARRSTFMDLTLGRAGVLIGCALLEDALARPDPTVPRLAEKLVRAFEARWTKLGSVRDSARTLPSLGIAHGWGGELYAVLRWCATSGRPVPEIARARLVELSEYGRRIGRGMSWARHWSGESDRGPSWCNGDTGLAFLWLQAAAIFPDDGFMELAELTLWNVWDAPNDRAHTLCCGFAGRAYGLLALHRATGDPVWVSRAKRLAERAVAEVDVDDADGHQLYKGGLGVALLLEELESPLQARMPLFESEGWAWKRAPGV